MGKTLVIAEKPSVGRDLASALPGSFPKSEGYLESDDYVITWAVGHLVELADPEEYDEKFKKWRMADLPIVPEEFQLEAARREVEEAAQPDPQAAEARGRRPGHQRLRRRARGRADLRLHLRALPQRPEEEGRRAEAGRAALDLVDDEAGDPRGLREPAGGRADAAARGGGAVPLRGRLARRHERHPRGDHPRPRVGGRRRLARPRADADARR